MSFVNFKICLFILVFGSPYRSYCSEYLDIMEENNFFPCEINDGTLMCNAKNMARVGQNKALRFSKPIKQKILKIEILNFDLEDISAYFFRMICDDLLSIKIKSKLSIKTIDPLAFFDCKNTIFLEISGAESLEIFSLDFTNVFSPLTSLEELKLLNLNLQNVTTDTFSSLSNLKSLTIQSLFFNSISTESFQNNKNLTSLTFIDIKNPSNLLKALENWPDSSKLSIKILNINSCDLKKFPKLSDNIVENLSQISLAKNPLEEIRLVDVANLWKLEVLSLASTKLNGNAVAGLKILTNLKDLKITDVITLNDLPVEIEFMQSLESIYLDTSKFEKISTSLPSSIKKISASNLQKPSKISSTFLSKCKNLNVLHLFSLPMDNIVFLTDNSDVLSTSLSILSLDNTSFLKERLFEFLGFLRNLEVLYLNSANIDFITDNVLFKLRNLKKLMLAGNHLRYEAINTEGFQDLARHLTYLDLSKNPLTYLPSCMFYNFPNFDGLILKENNFVCDCHMMWFYEAIHKNKITSPHLNFTCSYGPNEGKSFYQLSEKDLESCSTNILDNCSPSKNGFYKIAFSATYNSDISSLRISNINGSGIKFIFDHLTINVKQVNKTFHSDLNKYDLTKRLIDIKLDLKPMDFEVCLILNRNKVEYKYDYNCIILAGKNVVSEAGWIFLIGIITGAGAFVLIMIIVIVIVCQKCRLKKEKDHEYYEGSSSKYSEPDDTFKNPDDYTYVSNEQYSLCQEEYMKQELAQTNIIPPLPPLSFVLSNLPSKSMDNIPNCSKTSVSQPKSRFRKSPYITQLISKARSSSNLLETKQNSISNPNNSNSNGNFNNANISTLPRQYISRMLPQTPLESFPDSFPQGSPPPRPRLSNANIRDLLNNADEHLKHFSQYNSNNSLCTDESVNHPHSGDSGLGVSKVSNKMNKGFFDENSVKI